VLLSFAIAGPGGQCQNEPRAEDVARRQPSRLRPAGQLVAFVLGENKQFAILHHTYQTLQSRLRYHRESSLVRIVPLCQPLSQSEQKHSLVGIHPRERLREAD